MHFPFKVAFGYVIIAIVLVLALSLVYSNTTSLLTINRASREYIQKRNASDSVMSALLKEEQTNLKELATAIDANGSTNYLQRKMDSLSKGTDSVVVQSRKEQTHAEQNTTVEVIKSKRGFFKRLADAFKKEYAETLSVKHDSSIAVVDTLASPVNVANEVADILKQIDKQEKRQSQGKHKAVSKEMKELQMANAQLAIRSSQQINDLHKQERQSMEQSINQAIKARQHLLGQIAMLAIIAIAVTIILFFYIWRDQKKERQYRENLERANEETQRVMKQRERLLLTITHDIKAPAASISGFIDLMRDYVGEERGVACLNNIKSSADHLSELVAALLDYHQLENGLMELKPVSFSPQLLIDQCIEAQRILAERKNLSITSEYNEPHDNASSAPEHSAASSIYRADAFRIRQIINNLVSNAIKYTDKGSISISVTVRNNTHKTTTPHESALLLVKIKDSGRGMTAEEREKVFQPFTRLDNAQGTAGTGLGLSITHELVSLLGGNIQLQSQKGKGTVFTISIPMEVVTDNTSDHKPLASDKPSPVVKVSPRQHSFANNKVLVLDDDKLQLQLIQEMLSRLVADTWQVYACNHISEALTLIHQERPALMFMDIEMPEMNGMEMIRHINHTNMTVVAMTAHDKSFRKQIIESGFDDCLFKPFKIESIATIIGVPYPTHSSSSISLNDSTSSGNNVSSFLAFADGDTEAEKEIMNTMKENIKDYVTRLQGTLEKSSLPHKEISAIAHKLLPIVSMLQIEHTEEIRLMSPELISNMDDNTIRGNIRLIIADLISFLG